MNCHYHPDTEAAQECRVCSHPLCPACLVQIKGVAYCRDCLAERVETSSRPLPPPAALPDYRSPRAAGWLSVLPGLGLLYLGQYVKALVVVLAFMGAIQFADHSDAGGILVAAVWFGNIFYSVQEAKRLNRMKAGQAALPEPVQEGEGDSPFWGGTLIALGTLFLLDQFELIRFTEIFEKFWPLLIIGLGLQILFRGRGKGASAVRS